MAIIYSESTGQFHLYNDSISYILHILPNGEIGNLYFGKRIRHKEDFSYLQKQKDRPQTICVKYEDSIHCPAELRMEYPSMGRGDFRDSAFELTQENGSKITGFRYVSHRIYKGKHSLEKLPALYIEKEEEADSLEIVLTDEVLNISYTLKYSIYAEYPVIARSVNFNNHGMQTVFLDKVLSASLDLPDSSYESTYLSGAWSRERHPITRSLQQGKIQIGSTRGASSTEYNPFIAIKRKNTTENTGEAYGFSLIYSGNHIEQIEVDAYHQTRIQLGIHPDEFSWKLRPQEEFQSPEAVFVYSENGLNGMSQVFHRLYRTRLARGYWRDRVRPILVNNWEATEMTFTEDELLKIAQTAKELDIEMFVMDDGWFGNRETDTTGLGDWYVKNFEKLPKGVPGIANKIQEMGLKFGIWIEPEMVNMDSDLYRKHPEWLLCPPERTPSPARNQYVLDFSNREVVDYIFDLLDRLLSESPISYVKWDMNRYMSECYSQSTPSDEQGMVKHKYILGVYSLYERLLAKYPKVLFESCASGGGRFDPGLLYYAPQTWTSDDTDAIERLKIQYGTSYVYPISAIGSHVSVVPNLQVGRMTPIETRGNVAFFGTFGYELDLSKLAEAEKAIVKKQVAFMKQHRELIMKGDFYRISNPLEENACVWMVVSQDKKEALVGYYRILGVPNDGYTSVNLVGLDAKADYTITGREGILYGGDELMHVGMQIMDEELCNAGGDYSSNVYYLSVN